MGHAVKNHLLDNMVGHAFNHHVKSHVFWVMDSIITFRVMVSIIVFWVTVGTREALVAFAITVVCPMFLAPTVPSAAS